MEKKIVGEKVTDFIKDGMTIGLGTGSTVFYTINKIGTMVKEGLNIKAVSTSQSTTELARELNIPLFDLNDIESIDLTIDGADEIDERLNGIKGGGGALLFEKIVASNSKENIWVVDSSKMVDTLGKFPLPVEIIPFGYEFLLRKFEKNNMNPKVRKKEGKIYLTDSKNIIVDLHLNKIENVMELDNWLNNLTGVVEHGLFINIVDKVIVAKNNEAKVIEK
jgi:ribose 5-phosphate isomerase A